jgi:hypothetical protein
MSVAGKNRDHAESAPALPPRPFRWSVRTIVGRIAGQSWGQSPKRNWRSRLYLASFAVRWPSGRRRRFAKPLYGLKPVPRVRIPASPPNSSLRFRIWLVRQVFSHAASPLRRRQRERIPRQRHQLVLAKHFPVLCDGVLPACCHGRPTDGLRHRAPLDSGACSAASSPSSRSRASADGQR